MKTKFSNLQTVAFEVLEFSYTTINSGKDTMPATSYDIDIDFDIFEQDKKPEAVLVKMTIEAKDLEAHSYHLKLSCNTYFEITDFKALDTKTQINLKGVSSVNLAIGHTRGFLRTATAQGILGAFELPAVDIGSLFNQKTVKQ